MLASRHSHFSCKRYRDRPSLFRRDPASADVEVVPSGTRSNRLAARGKRQGNRQSQRTPLRERRRSPSSRFAPREVAWHAGACPLPSIAACRPGAPATPASNRSLYQSRVHRPTPQACDAPDRESCVETNRRPHQNADESRACASGCEHRESSAVIQQHRRDQPAPGAARSIIARQPAGAAQREQRSAGDTAHYQCGR